MLCHFVLAAFAFFLSFAAAQNFETGDNSTVRGCSNHCSYKDGDLECWNKTLVFFERILLGQMRNYVAVQMNIDQWRQRNVHPYKEEFERAKRHSVNTMIAQLHPYDVIDVRSVETLVNTLVDLAALQSNNSLLTWMPHVQCPIPCEHRYTVWRNLFILSSVLNVCLFIAILPLVKRMHNGDSCESLIQRA
uniref:Minor glycoprotein n=1 Tax=Globodera rostochiensis TaxID=31243 RepID=A0A914GZU4_GLORO